MNMFKVFIAALLLSTSLAGRVCDSGPISGAILNCKAGGSMKKQMWTFGVSCPESGSKKSPFSFKAVWADEKGQSSALKVDLDRLKVFRPENGIVIDADPHEGDNTFEFSLDNGGKFSLELQLVDTDCVFNSDSICPFDEVKGYERFCDWQCHGDEMDEGEKEKGTMEECAKLCDEKEGCNAFDFKPKGWDVSNPGKVDDSGLGECEFYSPKHSYGTAVGRSGDSYDGWSCVKKVQEQSGGSVEEQSAHCDACVSEFDERGGCNCWADENCDQANLIPNGCDNCGEAAAEFCGISGECKDIEEVFMVWKTPDEMKHESGYVFISCDTFTDPKENGCKDTVGSVMADHPGSFIPRDVQGKVTSDMTPADICPHVFKDICNTCATTDSWFEKIKKKFEEKDPVYLGIAGGAIFLLVLSMACCCCQGPTYVQRQSPNRRRAPEIVIMK